jgi:hypothetical protein
VDCHRPRVSGHRQMRSAFLIGLFIVLATLAVLDAVMPRYPRSTGRTRMSGA